MGPGASLSRNLQPSEWGLLGLRGSMGRASCGVGVARPMLSVHHPPAVPCRAFALRVPFLEAGGVHRSRQP